jgi:hypothetical protein
MVPFSIQLCTKHMAGFLASLESSPSPERKEFCENFLSEWNFLGILFGGLLARIVEYLQNGSLREVEFQSVPVNVLVETTSVCGVGNHNWSGRQ